MYLKMSFLPLVSRAPFLLLRDENWVYYQFLEYLPVRIYAYTSIDACLHTCVYMCNWPMFFKKYIFIAETRLAQW